MFGGSGTSGCISRGAPLSKEVLKREENRAHSRRPATRRCTVGQFILEEEAIGSDRTLRPRAGPIGRRTLSRARHGVRSRQHNPSERDLCPIRGQAQHRRHRFIRLQRRCRGYSCIHWYNSKLVQRSHRDPSGISRCARMGAQRWRYM
jgi:hypothetical protein